MTPAAATRRRKRRLAVAADPVTSAELAGLRYVSDAAPGIRRRRSGRGFAYYATDGRRISDKHTLQRIRSLAIPPAWTNVWICPAPNGHLQATGRDARGRKQYRYHPRWRQIRDETKYHRMLEFGRALPSIRRTVDEHLRLPRLPREKVLAAVVRLLETTLIRVGNEEYAAENNSHGLTTLRARHVDIDGSTLRFRFRGKGGKTHDVGIRDPRLARIVGQCQDIPGYDLFQYIDDDGQARSVDSSDVNAYLKEVAGDEFTAKDFRTWAGTVLAALALEEAESFTSDTEARRNVVRAIEAVAARLGNTPAVCRKCYVHPAVVDAYLDGTMLDALRRRADAALRDVSDLGPDEAAVLALLRRRLEAEQAAS